MELEKSMRERSGIEKMISNLSWGKLITPPKSEIHLVCLVYYDLFS